MEITYLNIPDMINTTELQSNTLENNVILGKTPKTRLEAPMESATLRYILSPE